MHPPLRPKAGLSRPHYRRRCWRHPSIVSMPSTTNCVDQQRLRHRVSRHNRQQQQWSICRVESQECPLCRRYCLHCSGCEPNTAAQEGSGRTTATHRGASAGNSLHTVYWGASLVHLPLFVRFMGHNFQCWDCTQQADLSMNKKAYTNTLKSCCSRVVYCLEAVSCPDASHSPLQ